MNGQAYKWFNFDPTINLGSVLKAIGWVALLIAGWVHMSDRISVAEVSIASQQDIAIKQVAVVQQMQIDQARTSIILNDLEKRLARDENEMDKKH